jgi:hypothetical protein
MDALTLFGFAAILIMLIAYILEQRSTIWLFIFATACVASSVYGWLAGTIPFGVVEIIWAVVAYRKWWIAKQKFKNDNLNSPPAQ